MRKKPFIFSLRKKKEGSKLIMSGTKKHDDDNSSKVNLMLIGDPGVGKTCFINKHIGRNFDIKYTSTRGVVQENFIVGTTAFKAYDFAGNEKFAKNREEYYEKTDAVIIMFDLTSNISYKSVSTWLGEAKQKCQDSVPIILVATKSDLIKVNPNWVSNMTMTTTLPYFKVSNKTGENIKEPLLYIAEKVAKKCKAEPEDKCVISSSICNIS